MTRKPELDAAMTPRERVAQMRATLQAQREHLERTEEEFFLEEGRLVLESSEFRDLDLDPWVLEEMGVEDRSEIGPTDLSVSDEWECQESPVGHCTYLHQVDEDCIFCGLSGERG